MQLHLCLGVFCVSCNSVSASLTLVYFSIRYYAQAKFAPERKKLNKLYKSHDQMLTKSDVSVATAQYRGITEVKRDV